MSDERRRARERAAALGGPDAQAAAGRESCRVGEHDWPDGLLYTRTTEDNAADGYWCTRTVYRACLRCGTRETVSETVDHDATRVAHAEVSGWTMRLDPDGTFTQGPTPVGILESLRRASGPLVIGPPATAMPRCRHGKSIPWVCTPTCPL